MHSFPPVLVQGYAKALQLQLWENQTGNVGASTTTAACSPFPKQDFSLWKRVRVGSLVL